MASNEKCLIHHKVSVRPNDSKNDPGKKLDRPGQCGLGSAPGKRCGAEGTSRHRPRAPVIKDKKDVLWVPESHPLLLAALVKWTWGSGSTEKLEGGAV